MDMRSIINAGYPFTFVIGGRGTGKTYTSLLTLYEDQIPFMLMRRTQAQVDMISKPDFSPFKPLENDHPDIHVTVKPVSKYTGAFYIEETVNESDVILRGPIGYTCALSTISNMRGFDASSCRVLLYDEFIPERHERPIKHEGDALLNAYETINRNRELKGQPALQLVALTNANDLACPIFDALGLIDTVDKMTRRKQQVYINDRAGILIVILRDSPISGAKADTALYKLTTGTDYASMALDNDFSSDNYEGVRTQNIREYIPKYTVGDICVYKHKSEFRFYITRHISGKPEVFGDSDMEYLRFRQKYGYLKIEAVAGRVFYEDVYCKVRFAEIVGL